MKEAEKTLLGELLYDGKTITEVAGVVSADDFSEQTDRWIFTAIEECFEHGEAVDIITVSQRLEQHGKLHAVSRTYLLDLVSPIITTENIGQHARIVRQAALQRRLGEALTRASGKLSAGAELSCVISEIEKSLIAAESHGDTNITTVSNLVKQGVKTIDKSYREKKNITGVACGYEDVDRLTMGFQNSDLVVLAGRPSMGKTALALNFLRGTAVPALFFSLEMSQGQLTHRLICMESEVRSDRVRSGYMSAEEYRIVYDGCENLYEYGGNVHICDDAGLNISQIRAISDKMVKHYGVKIIFIDYLQLISVVGKASREQEISHISRSLKIMAKDLNVPVIVLSQLNRNLEQRVDKRPQLSDLRESGAIEQDADVVMFIYRDEVYNPETEEPNIAEVIIGKQRNGPLGYCKLVFMRDCQKFLRYTALDATEGEF